MPSERVQFPDLTARARKASLYLPDFCAPVSVLSVIAGALLLTLIIVLARAKLATDFLTEISIIGLFTVWLSLMGAALLCALRGRLMGLSTNQAFAAIFFALQAMTLIVCLIAWKINASYLLVTLSSDHLATFVLRTQCISAIITAISLRYIYVTSEWRRNTELESHARFRALQAKIRPHFLFNSMNTIAELTRSDPKRAELAVEDLADLFRATLGEGRNRIALSEEIALVETYVRMERLRMGDRLAIEWHVEPELMEFKVPMLLLQPLVENAIVHGVAGMSEGGLIRITGARSRQTSGLRERIAEFTITNPVAKDAVVKHGNQHALDNISERLQIAYGNRARLKLAPITDHFTVILQVPLDNDDN